MSEKETVSRGESLNTVLHSYFSTCKIQNMRSGRVKTWNTGHKEQTLTIGRDLIL